MEKHVDATRDSGRQFFLDYKDKGAVVMLNLLKYREVADYSDAVSLAPVDKISGKEAYGLYMQKAGPILHAAGSKVIFFGKSKHFLIGPMQAIWDAVLLVEHKSVENFMAFAQNPDYLAIKGHRTAALEDARLLPISPLKIQ